MVSDIEERFRPLVVASYPATLAGLSLAAMQVTGKAAPMILTILLGSTGMLFLVSSFAGFFHILYPTRRSLWAIMGIAFVLGLASSLLSVIATTIWLSGIV
jgi:hypothetical protein